MQRCFRQGPAAAKNILTAGSGTDLGLGLGALLLSHLDYLDLCGENEEPLPGGKVPAVTMPLGGLSSSLRILGLHNCGGLGEKELLTVVSCWGWGWGWGWGEFGIVQGGRIER